jgi:predicted metalloprotease with PDZ domain
MKKHRIARLAIAIVIVALSISASYAQTATPDISFTVSMSQPWTHLLEVEMRVDKTPNSNEVDLVMPVWTPGSYMIREFERHVQDFVADDGARRSFEWTKIDKNTWRVKTNRARQLRVTYRVYANELTVRTNELNSDHAFWNNAALLMYPNGFLSAPSTLRVKPANGWRVATGLPAVAGQQNTFRAENFDILYDSPFEVSDFKELKFEVRGVPHRIVIDGAGNYNPVRLQREVQKIVEAEIALFGDIPYHDYTFILHLRSNTGGGLEHLNSTALGFRRFGFKDDDGYRRFDSLVAHEFFHLWNVKRIRPDALGPFDYTKENYTKLLWVAEGITEYYGQLILQRAGLVSDQFYLAHLASQIQDMQDSPGRLLMSAEEASFNAWIKEYRPDENSVNSQISYYDKGELLGLLLDLEMRRRTNNAKSLDDVMRMLYTDFYKRGRNYTPADFQKVCETLAGGSLERFFARYVRGREELPYNESLAAAGLQLNTTGEGEMMVPPAFSYLGADLEETNGIVIVTRVPAGTPAYEQGLNAKDQILALDGVRVNQELLETLIRQKPIGSVVRLTVFRNDDLRTLEIKLGSRVIVPYRIFQLPSRTDLQRQIYESWMSPTVQNRLQ